MVATRTLLTLLNPSVKCMLGFLFWVFLGGGDVLYLLLSPPAGQCMLMKIREFTFKDRLKVFKTNCIFSIYFYTKIWISIDRILVIPLSIVSKGQILDLCCDSCFSCVWGEGEIQAIFPPAFTANCMFPPPLCISLFLFFFSFSLFFSPQIWLLVCVGELLLPWSGLATFLPPAAAELLALNKIQGC